MRTLKDILYYVGVDLDDALEGRVFTDPEVAADHLWYGDRVNPHAAIYEVEVTIHLDTARVLG